MRKTRLAGVAVFLAAAVAIGGCGGGGGDADASNIDYWYWSDDATDNTIVELAEEFKEQTGITVTLQQIPNPQFYDKLITATSGGQGPDATHLFTPWLGQLLENNILAKIDDQIEGWEGKDDVIPSMWNYVESPDGSGTYALPNKQLMFVLYYRKDLFDAAGVDVPATQDEFLEVAPKLYDPDNGHYAFDIRGGDNGQDQWAAFLVAGGARFVNESGQVDFDSPESKAANQKYVDMFQWAPPGSIGNGIGQVKDNLNSGTAAMVIGHIGHSTEYVTKSGEDAIGVAPIPSTTPEDETTYLGSMNMNAVLESSDKKDAAFKWISFLTEQKAQKAITDSPDGYLPVVESVASDPDYADNPFFQVSMEEQKRSISWPALASTTVATQQVWRPIMQKAFLEDADPDDVIVAMAEALAEE